MRTYIIRSGFSVVLLFFILTVVGKIAYANISTGWRDFVPGTQEFIADDVFRVEHIEFLRNDDLRVKAWIRNRSKTEARISLNIAFFDQDKLLLVDINFAPSGFLMPGDIEHTQLEVPGNGNVYQNIRYYQISIVERE